MAPHASSSSSASGSSEASSSRAALLALPDATLQAPSAPLRRLLHQLSKASLIALVLHWLASSSPSIAPPSLSRRHASTSATSTFLELHEARRAASVAQLRQLWHGPMRAPGIAKARAVERVLDVDWPHGLTLHMCHMLACEAMRLAPGARTWSVARLEFDDAQGEWGPARMLLAAQRETRQARRLTQHAMRPTVPSSFLQLSPQTLQARLSKELSNYFTHHVHLADASPLLSSESKAAHSSADTSLAALDDPLAVFTHLRIVLPASASDVCAGLSLLHIPGTRWLLHSGTLGRSAGPSARQICLGAFAHAAHASGVTGAGAELGELRGRDALALRAALLAGERALRGVAGGGAARAMARAEEEGPLCQPAKRTRLALIGNEAALPVEEAQEEQEPSKARKRRKHAMQRAEQARREARELFGEACEVIERVDYEVSALPLSWHPFLFPPSRARMLMFAHSRQSRARAQLHLPLPAHGAYRAVAAPREAVRLRLSGAHLLAGLRAVVLHAQERDVPADAAADADADGEADAAAQPQARAQRQEAEAKAPVQRLGLPAWLTEVRGSRIVVRPTERD
jgi:hypothetical protein